jgi:ribose transport system substrate-binding protein
MSRSLKYAGASLALLMTFTLAACSTAPTEDQGAGSADTEKAAEFASIYLDAPSTFPVSEPLAKSPAGTRIAYMDCGTPICALFYTLIEGPAAQLGIEVTRLDAGQSADTVSTAFDTAAAGGFDGVFVPGISPALWEKGLADLTAAGIPVVTTGMTGGDAEQIALRQMSEVAVTRAADAMAGYVVSKHGADVDLVLYQTPELNFTTLFAERFSTTLDELCDGCNVRLVDIPVATLGNTATTMISDDLQAHPETVTALFSVGEQANGLAATLKTAGIDRELIAFIPTPDTLQQVKDGDVDAVLGLDLPIIAWTTIDTLAKLMTGQEMETFTHDDNPVMQFLSAADLPGDVSQGWTGYPDFPDRFAALWADAK